MLPSRREGVVNAPRRPQGARPPARGRSGAGRAGAGDDGLDHLGLGIGVLLDIGPVPLGQLALDPLVVRPVLRMAAQTVPEEEVALDLWTPGRVDVEVDIRVRPL